MAPMSVLMPITLDFGCALNIFIVYKKNYEIIDTHLAFQYSIFENSLREPSSSLKNAVDLYFLSKHVIKLSKDQLDGC